MEENSKGLHTGFFVYGDTPVCRARVVLWDTWSHARWSFGLAWILLTKKRDQWFNRRAIRQIFI